MWSSLDYAGFAQLCARSPIMRKIMRAHNHIIQRSLLNDETIPDDEKVKLYGTALRRYVNICNEIPARATDEPMSRPTVNIPPPPPFVNITVPSPDLDLTTLVDDQSRLLKRHVQPQRSRANSIRWDLY